MAPVFSGRCLCGAVRYRLTEKPLIVYACHCTDCQKRSGSAFGLSMWVRRASIELTQGDAALNVTATDDGRVRHSRICATCVTRLWSEPQKRPEIAVLRPGTLDDTSSLRPQAHLWTRSAQRWFAIPDGVPRYETQPDNMLELLRKT